MFKPDVEVMLVQMEKEAAPCPFCANKSALYCEDHGDGYLRCETCGARGPIVNDLEAAFELWDLRKGVKP